jgi:hypothetical protein
LFSELIPAKTIEFRKENDLSLEAKPVENTNKGITENENEVPLLNNKETAPQEITTRKTDNVNLSSGHKETRTKTILKIVEFYSDNTYKEFFPG